MVVLNGPLKWYVYGFKLEKQLLDTSLSTFVSFFFSCMICIFFCRQIRRTLYLQLQGQPKKDKNVRLHFDRITVRTNEAIDLVPSPDVEIHIEDRGAWSSIGRRKAQEDAFGKFLLPVDEIHLLR